VNGALVSENAIVPGKYVYCKRAFDERNVSHKLPVAKIKIRSPHFGFDDDVEIEVAVCESMPSGIDCNVCNSLFRQHPKLTDVLTIRPLSCQRPPAANSGQTQKHTASDPQRQSAGAETNDDQLTVTRHPAGGNRVDTATTYTPTRNLTRGNNEKTHLADEQSKLHPTRKVVNDTTGQPAQTASRVYIYGSMQRNARETTNTGQTRPKTHISTLDPINARRTVEVGERANVNYDNSSAPSGNDLDATNDSSTDDSGAAETDRQRTDRSSN